MAYRLTGDYKSCDYGKAWQQLMKYCEANKEALGDCWGEVEYINMYYDDPMQTPPAECRVDVCMVAKAASRRLQEVFGSLIPADGVQRITIPGGRYVVFTHKGPYDKLGETYGYIYGSICRRARWWTIARRVAVCSRYISTTRTPRSRRICSRSFGFRLCDIAINE